MLLLDIHSPTVPMPVPDFLNQSERIVSDQQQEELEAVGAGLAFSPHDYVANSYIYAVGPFNGEKKELYAVKIEGTPRTPMNKAFVSTARKLLSFDINKEPYPETDKLDFDPNAGPPRPAVVRALTKELAKNNGSGKSLPTMICV